MAEICELYFELPSAASLDQPTIRALSDLTDIQAIKEEVATLTGVASTDVTLKGGVFGVGELPINVDGGGAVGDTVFVYRIEKLQESSIRARTCSGESGGPPTLTSDVTLASEGAVLLVPATIKEGPAIVVYRIVKTTSDEFDADPYAPQTAFHDDVKDHLDADPWEMATGELTGPCE